MAAVERIARILSTLAGALLLTLALALGNAAAQTGTPAAPAIDSVSAGDTALTAAWSEPSDTGSSNITAYDLRYILTSADESVDANWTPLDDVWSGAGELRHTVTGLDNGVQYDVQVRAVNSRGDGAWSATETGTPADHGNNRGSATQITLQTPTLGYISSASDDDYFQFTLGDDTGIFIFTTSYQSGHLPTTGELQGSGGSVVKSDEDDPEFRQHGDQLLIWDTLTAGTYYVKVEAPEAGAYTLHTQPVPDSTSVDDATGLSLGGQASGILDPASGDEDFFRLELSASTDVMLRVTRAGKDFDPVGTLLDAEGGVVASHDDSFLDGDRSEHFIIRERLSAGVYYLKVSGAPAATFDVCRGYTPYAARLWVNCNKTKSKDAATEAGPYSVSAEAVGAQGSSFSSASSLTLGEGALAGGRIDSAGQLDYFSVTVDQPTHVAFQVVSDEIETEGAFFATNRAEVETYISDTDYLPGALGFTLHAELETGTSYIRVGGEAGAVTGTYAIRAMVDTEFSGFLSTCADITTDYDDPLYGCQWHLNNTGQDTGAGVGTSGEDINVEEVWEGGNLGEGVNIAIVDDSLYSEHEDLKDNVDASKNRDYTYRDNVFERHFFHGTYVAGLIAARDNNIGVRGVAPRATIYNYNFIRNSSYFNFLDSVIRNMDVTAVSNNSWGFKNGPGLDPSPRIWELAIERGISEGFDGKGVFYVFAGGNGAPKGDYSNLSGLANYYAVTTACAVDDQGERASYSEEGSNLWVCAPAGNPRDDLQGSLSTFNYDRYSRAYGGTSISTALVSGVAALVRKANPALTWRDVKLVLAGSARKNDASDAGWATGATKYGSTTDTYNFNHKYGFGVVDAKAAVDLAASWTNLPLMGQTIGGSAVDLDLAIADGGAASSTITMGGQLGFIEYVEAHLRFTHSSFRDLKVELVSPSGATSVLSVPHDSDDKYPLNGEFRFGTAAHLGESASGTWRIRVTDSVTGNSGTLKSWRLKIYGHATSSSVPSIASITPGNASLTLGWTALDDSEVTAYDVRHITSAATDKADANWTVVDNAVTTTSGALTYAISGLTNGTSYDVQVRAVLGSDDGAWSDTVVGAPSAGTAAVPTIDRVRSEDTALNVSWSAPTTPPATTTAYDVRHIRSDASDKADGNWTVTDNAWTSGTLAYTIPGLVNGYGYDVQVRAVSANGDGAWSTTAIGQPADYGSTIQTAGTLPLNSPVQGDINVAGDVDFLRLDVSATTGVLLYTTGDTDTVGQLLDDTGEVLRSNDDYFFSQGNLNFFIGGSLDAGVYYLRVAGWGDTTGSYVLWAEEVNDSTSTSDAITLQLGGSARGHIDDMDEDYFKLVLTAETDVVFHSSGPTDTIGRLDNSSGTELAENDDGYLPIGSLNFLVRQTLSAGIYYLRVRGYADRETGPYHVHAEAITEPGSTTADASALTLGVAAGGRIDPAGDTDYFSFTLAEPINIWVRAVGEPVGTDPLQVAGELLDADSNTLHTYEASNFNDAIGFSGTNSLAAGAYYIKVTGTTDMSTAVYTIMVVEDPYRDRLTDRCSGDIVGLSDPLSGCQWHLSNVGQLGDSTGHDLNVTSVWDDYTGEGIRVAIVDDGMDFEHEDLTDNVDADSNYSFVEGETVRDQYPWHGTSVSGIIAARDNTVGVRGVAPRATIYSYNLLSGELTDMDKADAMSQNAADTAIMNNSWGPYDRGVPSTSSGIWKTAIESAITTGYDGKGVFYVWAAGNGGSSDNSNLDEYANFYAVTAACAVNYDGERSGYSEQGANLWVCGPSNDSFFSFQPGITTTAVEDRYTTYFGGTSAAAPMVSGVAALMRDANDALTWRDIKLILAASARKVDANDDGWTEGALKYGSTSEHYFFNYEFGFGLVDAQAAVDLAESWTNLPAFRKITVSSSALSLSIPDYSGGDYSAVATDSLTVEPHVSFVEYVHVRVDIEHTSIRDLHIELVSPSGVVSVLVPSLEGVSYSYALGEPWDGQFQFGSAKHLGENGAGVWTLRITDRIAADTGTLKSWSITVYGHGDGPGFPEFDTVTDGVRSAAIEWKAPTITGSSSITSYDLRYRKDELASAWVLVENIWTSGTLSYTLTGLEGGTKYDIQIRAKSGIRAGPWSQPEVVEPMLTTPTAPSISATAPGNRILGVTWTPPPEAVGDEITSYDLRYILTSADEAVDSNWTVRTRRWTSGPLHYAQGGLTNGSGYDVQVRAVNTEGDGAWSPTFEGTPADQVNVRLQWASSATTVNENAGTVTLQAELVTTEAGTLPSGFILKVDVGASGTADSPADYTLQTASLTFISANFTSVDISGQTRYRAVADVVVAIVNDTVKEGDETVTLSLVYDAPSLPHLQGNNASLAVTIADDDHGPVTISWEQSLVTVDEGAGTATLRAVVTTSGRQAPSADFILEATVSSTDGSATKSVDFSPLSKSLVFTANDFRRTTVSGQTRYRAVLDVLLPIMDDGDDEEDEDLTVVLSFVNPTLPHLQGSSATARVTIKDNDFVPVTISWDQSSYSVDEHGSTITLQARATTAVDKMPESGYTVVLSAATTDDTATQGVDYRRLTNNFSFRQNDFSRTDVSGQFRFQAVRDIVISIIDDTADEPDEDFTATLAYRDTLQAHWTGGSSEATVTIVDNELPQVTLGWDETAFTVTEPTTPGGTTSVTLTAVAITLADQPPETGFTLDYTVATADGTASQPDDYEEKSNTESIPRNNFTSVTVDGQIRYRTTRTYTVVIEDDTVDEPNETFTVTLAFDDPNAPYLIPGDMIATITIEDNDHVAVTLAWQQTARTVTEPTTSGGTTTVMLRAIAVTATNKKPETGFVLDYTVDSANGTAQEPADYEGVSSTESFVPSDFSRQTIGGQRRFVASQDFTLTIADDVDDEPNETFTVTLRLTNPSLPHLSIEDETVTITINDNDHVPVELSWEQSSFTVDEDVGTVTLTAEVTTTVDKMPESGFSVRVAVEAVDDSATRNSDFRPLSTTHRFRQSDFSRVDTGGGTQRYRATRDFSVTIVEDILDEPGEQFEVVLSYNNPSLPHLRGGSVEATVTIRDNDHVPVTLGWEETQFTAEEPTSPGATTPVTLRALAVTETDKRPESGFTFDFTVATANGTARQPGDYEQLSTTETFDRNDFSRTNVDGQFRWVASRNFTVRVKHDTVNEPIERFSVRLSFVGPSQPYLLQGDMTATVTTTDDIASLADLRTTVSSNRSLAAQGDEITYSWSLSNSGPASTTNTVLTGTLDAGVTFVSAAVSTPSSAQCRNSGRTVTCSLGTVNLSDTASGTIVVEVAASASADITFTATAEGDQLDSTPADNDESATTQLDAPPRLITNLQATGAGGHIDLTWSAPSGNGSPITSYELERKAGADDYIRLTAPDPKALSYRDEGVVEDTEYTYRLRAINEDGEADWSNDPSSSLRAVPPPPPPVTGGGGGGFGPAPVAPSFTDGFRTTLSIAANVRSGGPIGEPVTATHPDDFEVTYSLSGTDAALFTVDEETGQIRVREGTVLATDRTYTMNLTATDSAGFGAIIIVTIEVTEASFSQYDLNNNNKIDRDEVIAAVGDYFDGDITKEEVIELVKLYFAG